MSSYTRIQLTDVADAAPGLGAGEVQESRFAHGDLGGTTGVAYHRFKPGQRQLFAHRHEAAEETYVVVAGSGRVKLDDDVVELEPLVAIRVDPPVWRAFEAGPAGLQVLAFGPHHAGDGEIAPGWWAA
jgi:mannose-6-phosphate isomerase-like protein (cupin superfamily)